MLHQSPLSAFWELMADHVDSQLVLNPRGQPDMRQRGVFHDLEANLTVHLLQLCFEPLILHEGRLLFLRWW